MQPVANGAPVRGPVRSALDALQIGAAATFARPNHIPRHRFQARVSATIQHVQRETGRVLRLRSYDAGVEPQEVNLPRLTREAAATEAGERGVRQRAAAA